MITHAKIVERLAELRTTAEAATNETGRWRWDHGFGDMCNDPECPYGALVDEAEPGSNHAGTVLMQVHGYDVHESWQGAAHIATWDPARSLRWLSWAEQVAAEHPETAHRCDGGDMDWGVCGPIRRLATALGLEET